VAEAKSTDHGSCSRPPTSSVKASDETLKQGRNHDHGALCKHPHPQIKPFAFSF
jgi:hypothetical protein